MLSLTSRCGKEQVIKAPELMLHCQNAGSKENLKDVMAHLHHFVLVFEGNSQIILIFRE